MIVPLVTDGVGIGRNNDFKIFFVGFGEQINIHYDTQNVAHFIGNVLHQFFAISHSHNLLIIVHTDIDGATLCICKAANPFEVVIVPRLFVFYILTLAIGHRINNLRRQRYCFFQIYPNQSVDLKRNLHFATEVLDYK